ncbi:MAG: hypothetical protein JOY64_10160 [Alphaproteobacteria bacterium]|nr:hypothetical protein [Alphaproteobacteria bacterium]
MIGKWSTRATVGAVAVVCLIAAAGDTAEANPFFAQQTGRACADCHNPGQEQRGVQGLNATGLAFKDCGFKFGCTAPAPAAKTSEHSNGIAVFHNNNCSNARLVAVRTSSSQSDQGVVLIIEPGQSVKVAVIRGSTWAGQCGGTSVANPKYAWITLDQVLP